MKNSVRYTDFEDFYLRVILLELSVIYFHVRSQFVMTYIYCLSSLPD